MTYVEEPDNVDTENVDVPGGRGFGPYPVLRPGEESSRYASLWEIAFAGATPTGGAMLAAGRGVLKIPQALRDPLVRLATPVYLRLRPRQRTVVKSILSIFSVEWLAERFSPAIVVIQRDPRNVISSFLELDFTLYDTWDRRDILARYEELTGAPPPPVGASHVARTAWTIGVLATALGAQAKRHPEWHLVTHEELCIDPRASYRELCADLGLDYGPEVEAFLARSDRPGSGYSSDRVTAEQPTRWRERLSAASLDEIESVLAAFPDHGWAWQPARVPA